MLVSLAEQLWNAQETQTPCDPLTTTHPDFSVEEAYEVQRINLTRRIQNGAHLVGHKIGLTSLAVQEWLGVSEPDFGGLLDTMSVPNGSKADIGSLLQPRVEGELAFVFKQNLCGPGITPAQVIAATDFVLPAIEIIDSRIKDWKFKIQDTIADNASSGMFVVGSEPAWLDSINTQSIGLTLKKNGAVVSTGAGAACLGDPVNAVVWLVNKLGTLGVEIEAGHAILSGALGPVVPVAAGDYINVQIGRMAEVSVRF